MFKSGYVVIVGRPNVGKSTLMNHLIGQKIAITSRRAQTTRNRIETVLTTDEGQIIFLDTPGMLRKTENKLGEYLMDVSVGTLKDADVILWLVEPSDFIGAGDRQIAERLLSSAKPVILVINKTDTVDKGKLGGIIAAWSKVMDFSDIVCVSALRSVNLDELTGEILKLLPEGPKYYDEEVVTDQTMRQIASEIIREKALRALNEEVPHGIAVVIDSFRERSEDLTAIEASIICERTGHKAIVIGKGGSMLKKIGTEARRDIEEMLGTKVFLKLFVKVRKNWRDSESDLRNFGYDRKKL